jgi:hypothetical protein
MTSIQTRAWENGAASISSSAINPDRPARSNDLMETVKSILGTGGFIRLTAAQAALILRLARYPSQTRDLKPAGEVHIKVLADTMRRKEWRKLEKLDFALIGGRYIMLNGHHRLGAQAISGEKILWVIVVHECSTMEEVQWLYRTFDVNQKVRTAPQILTAMETASTMGIPMTAARALYGCVPLIAANFDFTKSAKDPLFTNSIELRLQAMAAVQQPILAWVEATANASPKIKARLSSQGALGVALMALKWQERSAMTFWKRVADNDALPKGTPEHTYVKYLLETNNSRGTPVFTARAAALAWNAHFAGRRLSSIRIVEGHGFRIDGTPIGD